MGCWTWFKRLLLALVGSLFLCFHSHQLTFSGSEHVARAGGLIMDACTEPDNTVQGDEYAWGNGNIAVHIVKKGIF